MKKHFTGMWIKRMLKGMNYKIKYRKIRFIFL